MAGSKDEKNQKPETNFADDLDSMLNLDDNANRSVGLIDDDDAIDRLLIDDAFGSESSSEGEELQPMDEVEQLIAGELEQDSTLSAEYDEFGDDIDDLIADIQINPKQQKAVNTELPVLDDAIIDEVDQSELETVGQVDDFLVEEETDLMDSSDMADMSVDDIESDTGDVLENMAEIDEFSDQANSVGEDSSDFLMADFDISVDDELGSGEPESVVETDQSGDVAPDAPFVAQDASAGEQEDADAQDSDELDIPEPDDISEADAGDDLITAESDETVGDVLEAASAQPEPEMPEATQPGVDYAALIAGLTAQVTALKKQHKKIDQDIQVKSNKDELTACLESIDKLQSEQKRAKRMVDALSSRKPVSAYVAIGLAILALIVGGSLGYQGYQAKNQAAQIVEYLGKMQAEINAVPTADGTEKEMLRNQLDELARANSIASEQIAELTKTVKGEGSGNAAGDGGTQLSELAKQDMQMGAAIESLQAKVSALEKGKASASVVKPVAKKPPVVTENWVVNLVAFKQDWYAKRKAEEYVSKGVPAKVGKAESKGETWYRLSVDGFKSQYEAAAYAARVKKTLNLDSVWVNKNKN